MATHSTTQRIYTTAFSNLLNVFVHMSTRFQASLATTELIRKQCGGNLGETQGDLGKNFLVGQQLWNPPSERNRVPSHQFLPPLLPPQANSFPRVPQPDLFSPERLLPLPAEKILSFNHQSQKSKKLGWQEEGQVLSNVPWWNHLDLTVTTSELVYILSFLLLACLFGVSLLV